MEIKATRPSSFYKSRPVTYTWILSVWFIIMCIFEYYTINYSIIPTYQNSQYFLVFLLILNQIFVATFFFWNFKFGNCL
jgi:hypothetical protein